MTVHGLLTQMPANELTYWLAYYTILQEEAVRDDLKRKALMGLGRGRR